MTGELFLRSSEVAAWVDRCAAWFPPVAPSAASDRALSAPLVSEQLHADIVRALSSIVLTASFRTPLTDREGIEPMSTETNQKVTASHLKRSAYLYVRQSTVRQVFENTESTQRQYALRQRAIALGWPSDRVIVIDSDLGQSGASAVDREGFQRLVAEVGMGRAGIVLGLEVSRLARNSTDWHRLLEICALTDTLILDEDGIYDPAHFNDRLLLGLKGTMSEAELHMLRARLRGGILNKARRGDLRCRLPVGLVYDTRGCVVFDPDKQVQETVRLLFQTFDRTGTLRATIKYFRKHGLLFPTQIVAGAQKGQLAWVPLSLGRASSAMHNPWYAGAYAYGRSRWRKQPDGRECYERLPQDQWQVLIRDAHPAYISWQEYERNAQRLRASAQALGFERNAGPPREGPALLQGRVVCGLCGSRMNVRYNIRRNGIMMNKLCMPRPGQALRRSTVPEYSGNWDRRRGRATARRCRHAYGAPARSCRAAGDYGPSR